MNSFYPLGWCFWIWELRNFSPLVTSGSTDGQAGRLSRSAKKDGDREREKESKWEESMALLDQQGGGREGKQSHDVLLQSF